MSIAIISANLGNFDSVKQHSPQSISYDYFLFTDENFPPRFRAMTPRLQSKIPKCFAWQMVPGYDYYLWMDSTLTLSNPDSLKYFYDNCKGYDVVTLKHPDRNNIQQESKFLKWGLITSKYISDRYQNELLKEQMEEIRADKNFVDDILVVGGIFMYRNTKKVQKMLKEWWYHISRYHIVDQIAFSYVLKKSGVKVKILKDNFRNSPYLRRIAHRRRA